MTFRISVALNFPIMIFRNTIMHVHNWLYYFLCITTSTWTYQIANKIKFLMCTLKDNEYMYLNYILYEIMACRSVSVSNDVCSFH